MPLLLAWLIHGLVIAALVRGALRYAGATSAATRYAVQWAALVIVLALPLALLTPELPLMALVSDAPAAGPARSSADRVVLGDATVASATHAAGRAYAVSSSAAPDAIRELATSAVPEPAPLLRLPRVPDWAMAVVIGLWLGIVSVGLLRVAQSIDAIQRLKAVSRPFPAARARKLAGWRAARRQGRLVELRLCDEVSSASFLGITRPVIAISPALAESLTDEELDLTVMHEFAHVQRWDDWTKLVQLVVMACCGWHPGVRLLDRAIDLERESACDDWVVRRSGSARGYARCLVKIVQTMPASAEVLVPGAYDSPSAMETRVKRLLDKNCRHSAWAPFSSMATACAAAMLAFVLTQVAPMRALAGHVAIGEARDASQTMASRANGSAGESAGAYAMESALESPAGAAIGTGNQSAFANGSHAFGAGEAPRLMADMITTPADRSAGFATRGMTPRQSSAEFSPAAFRPAVLTTSASPRARASYAHLMQMPAPAPAVLDAALFAGRGGTLAPPTSITSITSITTIDKPSARRTDDRVEATRVARLDAASDAETSSRPADEASSDSAEAPEDLRGAGRATLGAINAGTRKAGSAGAAAGEGIGAGLANAGMAAGSGFAEAGLATGEGFKQAGVATGHGLSTAGRAAGDGVATAGVATGHGVAAAAQKTGRALSKMGGAFKIF